MLKSILITGANAGLGKEAARQLALQKGMEKIYLGCRNLDKAKAAKLELERSTGKSIFEIVLIDVADLNSVRAAVESLKEPIEGLIMNAGGTGGKRFYEKTKDGVTQIFAVNLLGHVVLTEALLKAEKLTKVTLYAGSEAARGVKEMGMKRPDLKSSSVDEFTSICNGIFFGNTKDATKPYGPIKYMAALWMSSIARQYPEIRFVTMSPGATTGTEGFNTLSPVKQYIMKGMMRVMLLLGKVHKLEVGAKRFVDGVQNESFKSGVFYASKSGLTGPIADQGTIFSDLNSEIFQDNANAAIHRFIK
ncbi:SDR family NAD(P)-dependent oxidoreductase [Aliikangiella coralliicola]|uniref:SDR family NAD(P)-dependent oxidoreductase n=1 Tax=Aliikangiella coralliicola TaxID=2592383 RepID=A0A545UE90_9GAMM|nr:SDR family NAD(P)-dependent oxidoreductase [Aliikangiella coralliicola]TQV87778.1 SDR family NAD(P)-dependent oxidoreductase [Aliikangiella coralliicola]